MRLTEFRSILWQQLDLRVSGYRIHRLELHRHLPEHDTLPLHSHAHWQALLYLSGVGIQTLARKNIPVRAGTLLLLPPQVTHAFQRSGKTPALCLVLAFQTRALRAKKAVVEQLTGADLIHIRTLLAGIARLDQSDSLPVELHRAAAATTLLSRILQAAKLYPATKPPSHSPLLRRVRKEFQENPHLEVRGVASRLGLQRDYLNRRLKEEAGMTLGQVRADILLTQTKRHLRQHKTVAEAAQAAGFLDQNYFARWFRQQTGMSPSLWRNT